MRKAVIEIELQVTVLSTGEVATLTGFGTWFKMRFAVSGNKRAVKYLTTLLRDGTHGGYNGYTGPWGGRIGGSAPKLLDVLAQLDHDTPGCAAEIEWHFVRPRDPAQLPLIEGGEREGVVY